MGIEIPVLKSGGAEYDASLARRDAALSDLHQTARKTVSLIHSLVSRLEARNREIDYLLSDSAVEMEKALKLVEVQYASGKLDVIRLLSAHRAYSELKLEYLKLLLEQHEAIIDIEEIIGRRLVHEKGVEK